MTSSGVDITTDDGVCDAYLSQPDSPGPHPAVLFWPDAIGVRQRLYDMADTIASWGYVVLLPNIFYRSGRVPLIENLGELLQQEDRAKLFAALRRLLCRHHPPARASPGATRPPRPCAGGHSPPCRSRSVPDDHPTPLVR